MGGSGRGPDPAGAGTQDVFLLAVAHDLRGSVAAIAGALDVLRSRSEQLATEEVDTLLRTMADAVAVAEEVIANLFDAERLRYGAARLVRAPVHLPELVQRALDASGTAGRVRVDVDDAVVHVDAGLTERILVNLVRNAVTHTPPGTSITVCGRDEGEHVSFHVDDDGPGIPAARRAEVFEPFRRAAGQGTGVGLHLVREFARLHGGDATVEDRPKGGTSVRVRLPIS